MLIVAVFSLTAWFDASDSTVTGLTTLIGTGLGFIGGMVSREKKEPQATKSVETKPEKTDAETTSPSE